VQVQNNSLEVYKEIGIEVWVCDPTTVIGPTTALFPNASTFNTTLVPGDVPPTGTITTIRVKAIAATSSTQAEGFVPYPGMTALPGGHVCLIANCYGVTLDEQTDGTELLGAAGVNLPVEVQTNAHVAQHNIFASGTIAGRQRQLSFLFKAATPLSDGEEEVSLELLYHSGAASLTAADLAFLHQGPFKHLPLHGSVVPLQRSTLNCRDRGSARSLRLQLHADQPLPLSVDLDFSPHDKIGGVHVFDVIQKSATGDVQGGLRLLAVIAHP
jgi:hypothetical protein